MSRGRRTCPGCGTRWVLRLNPGAPHRVWHDDPRCADCRTSAPGPVLETDVAKTGNPVASTAAPDLYASLTRLLTPEEHPDGDPMAAAHRANALQVPPGDRPGPWLWDGLCRQVDTDLFFPEKGASTREAKQVCRRCPVIDPCRDWALATGQPHGVWGGLSAHERRALLRERAAS